MTENEPKKRSLLSRILRDQQMGARRNVVEEMFNDYYKDRHNIYKINFFRGIFFGLGSVIGGTIVVALLVWLLSFFVEIPVIGPSAQQAQDRLQSTK